MDPFDQAIIGESEAVAALRHFGRRAAAVDAPVLLTGDSGTGKSVLARAIHNASTRRRGPFVAVNCAGVPDGLFESEFFGHRRGAFTGANQPHRGLFEQAHRGTLLLDEIGELPLGQQAKLLTAIERGEIRRLGAERTVRVDARVIAATNADLERAVRERRFRRDLLHRLLVLSHRIPPLRTRNGDIERLARLFLQRAAERYGLAARGFTAAAERRLHEYDWPGNVRELAHAVEAAALACDGSRIRIRDLPARVRDTSAHDPSDHPDPALPDIPPAGAAGGNGGPGAGRYSFYGSPAEERRHIQRALRRCRGNKTQAARALGMARNTLRLKIRTLGIEEG